MRWNGVAWWFMVAVVVATTEGKEPDLHRVGGKRGWTQNVNYTEWAMNQTFYVGDWLLTEIVNVASWTPLLITSINVCVDFGFDRHIYNVLEVNQTSYQQCNDKGFIKNITRGGRDVYNLTEAKQFYFLSSGGYCFHGMKLAVNVVEFVPSAQPVLYESGSPIPVTAILGKPSLLHLICFGLTLIRILNY
ncbi:early nodulin-like protein 20 [Apium graveolens]|uniref:early nodulin-like protein 20 n=1 Tax=Apium graveolens TaxID=4045 RepID=UPI003D7B0C93